jgi:hypothetical protein
MGCVAPIEQVAKQQRVERGGNRGKNVMHSRGVFDQLKEKGNGLHRFTATGF